MNFQKKLKIASKNNLIVNMYTKNVKAKIKSYNGKINTNFPKNKIPKAVSQFISLSVFLIESVFRTGKKFC